MDFRVRSTNYGATNRGWLRGPHGAEPGANPSVVLDLTKFTNTTVSGVIPSGTVVGRVTTGGLVGEYDPAASDGRQTAIGLLFNPEPINTGQTKGANALVQSGNIDPARLPFQTGKGSLDAAAKTALPNLITA